MFDTFMQTGAGLYIHVVVHLFLLVLTCLVRVSITLNSHLILLQGVKGAQVEEIYDLSKPFRG